MIDEARRRPRFRSVQEQGNVIYALMLRDIKTRFFGNGLGYILYIFWPLSHILVIVLMFTLGQRVTPFGDSSYVYIATGTTPFMCFSYSSRFIMMAYMTNRPLLSFPAVKLLDVIIARAILETLTAVFIVLILLSIFCSFGIDPVPKDVPQAIYALMASIFLGVGLGVVNSVIVAAFPFYFTAYVLLTIIFWASAGIVFVPDDLPEMLRWAISFNPILHGVIWMRSAYFPGYGALTLDKTYLLQWGGGSLFAGLILERLARGRLLEG